MDANAENPQAERGAAPWVRITHAAYDAAETATLVTCHHRSAKIHAKLENARLGRVQVQSLPLLATVNQLLEQANTLLHFALRGDGKGPADQRQSPDEVLAPSTPPVAPPERPE